MITERILRDEGYRFYDDSHAYPDRAPFYKGLWQKKVMTNDDSSIRYFMNLEHWVFPSPTNELWELNLNLRTITEGYFTIEKGFHSGGPFNEVETFAEKLFTTLGCENYD